jgi:hypothetical protein
MQLKWLATEEAVSSLQRMQVVWLFCKFTLNPEAMANIFGTLDITSMSPVGGLKKRIASSA